MHNNANPVTARSQDGAGGRWSESTRRSQPVTLAIRDDVGARSIRFECHSHAGRTAHPHRQAQRLRRYRRRGTDLDDVAAARDPCRNAGDTMHMAGARHCVRRGGAIVGRASPASSTPGSHPRQRVFDLAPLVLPTPARVGVTSIGDPTCRRSRSTQTGPGVG